MPISPPTIILHSRAPFSFDLTLAYFQRRSGELVDRVEESYYRRLLSLNGSPVLAQARSSGDSDRPELIVELLAGDVSHLPLAAAALQRSFGLEDDLEAFLAAVAPDPVLSALTERHRGLRLVRTQSAFEALVWAIIGQQITLTFAFRLKSALVRTYGQSLNLDGTEYWAFPSPEPLAEADQAALAASGLGRRKAATITNVAQLVASGALDLEGLRLLPREEAIARLVELPGIGPWTAAYTLLRGLGDAGVCPVSDLGLRAAVGRLYGAGSTATVAEVAALSERWGEWRGYAAFYLWNALAERAG